MELSFLQPLLHPLPLALLAANLLAAWPEGKYHFRGAGENVTWVGFADLSHKVPAGPKILVPQDRDIVPAIEPIEDTG